MQRLSTSETYRHFLLMFLFSASALIAPFSFAQAGSEEKEEDIVGFWPSERMTTLFFDRLAYDIAEENKLDDEQRQLLAQNMKDRWIPLMKETRKEAMPVINEFFEMRLEMKPPSKEKVMDWANRADPLFQLVKKNMNDGIEDFRGILNPLQRAKFEAEVLKFSAGIQMAESKLNQWKEGEFNEREFWDPPRRERERRWEERRKKREAEARGEEYVAAEPVEEEKKDQIEQELGLWEKYVEQMIKTYDFDDSQKASAQKFLAEQSERARKYRDRNRDRIARLEARIEKIQAIEKDKRDKIELKKTREQLVSVYGPVDTLFQELKRKVESIPTAEQIERFKRGEIQQNMGGRRQPPQTTPAAESRTSADVEEETEEG